MTDERLQRGNDLAKQISDVKGWLTNCNIMLKHRHDRLNVSSSITFNVPKEIASGILQLSKDALERQLASLQKEYNEL